jgi:hypothetical protein
MIFFWQKIIKRLHQKTPHDRTIVKSRVKFGQDRQILLCQVEASPPFKLFKPESCHPFYHHRFMFANNVGSVVEFIATKATTFQT